MNCKAAPNGVIFIIQGVSSQSMLPHGRGWCKVKGGMCLHEDAAGDVSQMCVSVLSLLGEQGGIVGG